jgi:YegS/Rv2252/BmrU family lipid kinase
MHPVEVSHNPVAQGTARAKARRPERLAVVVNPVAGGGSAGKALPEITRALARTGLNFTCEFTAGPRAGIELAQRALYRGCDTVVAVGGDGTLNEVVNGLLAEKAGPGVRLGIIPCGSGSDLARTLGIPRSPAGAVARLAEGRTRLVDAGRIRLVDRLEDTAAERYFLNIADAGLGGETADRVNRMGKRLGGFLSFFCGALVSISTYRSKQAVVTVDNTPPEAVDLTILAAANGRYFAGGMMVAPEAVMDDGLFDLVLVPKMGRLELVCNLLVVYRGKHIHHPKVILRRGRRVLIEAKERVYVEADGEFVGCLPAEFTMLPQVLSVIC